MQKNVILCVDDEKIILNSLKTQLKENFGTEFIYETAENAADAEDIIDEMFEDNCKIVIIVSDWLMPGIKGDEFLIRIHRKHPKVVKILLSGHASPEAIDRAINEANLYKCIAKPWTAEELVKTVKDGLDLYHS